MSYFFRLQFHNGKYANSCKAIFALVFFPLLISCSQKYSPPIAKLGTLDAQNWYMSKSNLELRGEWRFFWKKFLQPNDLDHSNISYVIAGRDWSSAKHNGKPIPSFGYGTFRLDVNLPETNEVLALSIPVVNSAYRLYIDGILVHENGIVSEFEAIHRPSYHTKVIPIPKYKRKIRIQLDVSNYTNHYGGMKEFLRLGKIEKVYSRDSQSYIINWLLIFIIFVLAFYHFSIYAIRRSERASYFLGLLYFGVTIVALTETEGRILFNFFPDELCNVLIRISKIGVPICIVMGMHVLYYLFLHPRYKQILNLTIAYTAVNICISLFATDRLLSILSYPIEVIEILFFIIGIIISVSALLKGRRDGLMYVISITFVAFSAFYESIYNGSFVSNVGSLRYMNVIFFLVPQSYLLTRSIVSVFKSEENASRMLIKSNEDLESKVKDRTLELHRANKWKANFVSLMSHDLRSPLIGVSQILDVLQFKFSTIPDDQKQKFILICKEGIQNSLRMLKSLLDVSRFDSDGIRLQQSKFTLKSLIEEVVQYIRPLATIKEVEIQQSIDQESFIVGDRALLEEVFKNILTNAVKYSYPATSVMIKQVVKGDWVSIEIHDSGMGMEDEMIYRILGEKVKKSQPGTNGELGSGLGLRLCVNILEAHFSKLKIKSEPGKGSVFEVQFSKHTKCILLVDDSDGFRSRLAEELRRKKWIVIEALNGEEGLSHLGRLTPDLIVTDKEMPIMDGISFLHEWEAIRGELEVPILLISSDISLSSGEEILADYGLDDMNVHPVSKLLPMDRIIEQFSSYLNR